MGWASRYIQCMVAPAMQALIISKAASTFA